MAITEQEFNNLARGCALVDKAEGHWIVLDASSDERGHVTITLNSPTCVRGAYSWDNGIANEHGEKSNELNDGAAYVKRV